MKKSKIDLKSLKVTSFVTSKEEVKGGAASIIKTPTNPTANTMCYICPEPEFPEF